MSSTFVDSGLRPCAFKYVLSFSPFHARSSTSSKLLECHFTTFGPSAVVRASVRPARYNLMLFSKPIRRVTTGALPGSVLKSLLQLLQCHQCIWGLVHDQRVDVALIAQFAPISTLNIRLLILDEERRARRVTRQLSRHEQRQTGVIGGRVQHLHRLVCFQHLLLIITHISLVTQICLESRRHSSSIDRVSRPSQMGMWRAHCQPSRKATRHRQCEYASTYQALQSI